MKKFYIKPTVEGRPIITDNLMGLNPSKQGQIDDDITPGEDDEPIGAKSFLLNLWEEEVTTDGWNIDDW